MKTVARSILAVLAGYLTLAILTMATIALLGVFFPNQYGAETATPSVGWIVFNLVYSALFVIVGGYLTARLAPKAPQAHALVLGGIMALLALGGLLTAEAGGPQPMWYLVALVLMPLPATWVGAQGYERRAASSG